MSLAAPGDRRALPARPSPPGVSRPSPACPSRQVRPMACAGAGARALPFRAVRPRLVPILISRGRRLPDRPADLRHLHAVGEPHAGHRGARRPPPGRTRRERVAARPRRSRQRLAGLAARQGRAPELLGLVVPALRTRGAAARAGPGDAAPLPRHRAGRDLQGRDPRLRELRAAVPPHLPEPARRQRQLRRRVRHRPAPRELHRRPLRARRRRSTAARSGRNSSKKRSRSRAPRDARAAAGARRGWRRRSCWRWRRPRRTRPPNRIAPR